MLFQRFVLNNGPLVPRNVWVRLQTPSGLSARAIVRSNTTMLSAGQWLSVSLDLSEASFSIFDASMAPLTGRAAMLDVLGSVSQCVLN